MENTNSGYTLITIKELFDKGKRAFRIPEYQRGYSWEKEQREDLMKDILYVLEGNYTHYTGTIVATATKDVKTSIESYDIVDGQQRLTTLILLLSVIYNSYSDTLEDGFPKFIKDIETLYIRSNQEEGNTIRKFTLQSEHDDVFYNLVCGIMTGYTSKTKSEQNLKDAIKEFSLWIEEYKTIKEDIAKTIIDKLGFLFYTPDNSNEIGIMFEVINNRGKDLSELEKVKNYLIYFADKNNVADLKIKVEEKWGNILKNLNVIGHNSNQQENSFLRNCWIVFQDKNKSRSHNVYDNLKLSFHVSNKKNWKRLCDFIDFVDEASLTYRKLYSRQEVNSEKERKVLKLIAFQPQTASILPLLIAIYARDIDALGENSEMLVKLLKIIEKLNFRYYVLNVASRSDSGQGEIFHWAYHFFNNKHYSPEVLYEHIINFIHRNVPDKKMVEYLTLDKDEPYDYIHWQGLKYFLANYENHLRKKKKESIDLSKYLAARDKESSNNFYHREHIWAIKEFTVINDEEKRDINKRRLGNFILLKESQNIKVSNARVEDKLHLYWEDRENDPNTLMIRKLKKLFEDAKTEVKGRRTRKTYKYWLELYQLFLDKREQKLVNFALKRWRVEELPEESKIKEVTINSFVADKNEVYSF